MILYWGCSKLWFLKKLPFRCPFAPYGVPAKSGQGSVIMFSCAYFALEGYMRIALETILLIPTRKWKHSPKSFYRLPDNGNTSCLDFGGCLQWQHCKTNQTILGQGGILADSPFANLPRTFRGFLAYQNDFDLMFHERMGGCFSSNTKTHSYLRKNSQNYCSMVA